MSYCRFQNTLIDFRDCIEAIESGSELSDDEAEAANELAALAAKLVRLMTTISEHGADGSVRVIDCDSRTESHHLNGSPRYEVEFAENKASRWFPESDLKQATAPDRVTVAAVVLSGLISRSHMQDTAKLMIPEAFGLADAMIAEGKVSTYPAQTCPECGAIEVAANTQRTVYSCGSSDYDQRPGTFINICGGSNAKAD